MKLSNEAIELINKSNNLAQLRELIRQYLNIRYEWINKISDIKALKFIILEDLFEDINNTLFKSITSRSQLEKLPEELIKKLYELNIYSKEEEKTFLLLKGNIKIKTNNRSKNGNRKKSMSRPKKRKQKKALSN